MFFLFFSLTHSYFLAPKFDRSLNLGAVSNVDQIYEIAKKAKYSFMLCGESGEGNLAQTYIALKEIFPDFEFIYAEEKVFDSFYTKEKMTSPVLPALVVFENGAILTAVSQINNANQLVFLVELYGNQNPLTIPKLTPSSVPQVLGHAPITIITTPQNFSRAFQIAKHETLVHGPISIVQLPKEQLEQISIFDSNSACVFRAIDGHVQSFDIRSIRSFTQAIVPFFHYGTLHDIKSQQKDIFAFYAPLCHSFLKDLLIAVGQQLKPLGFMTYFVSTNNVVREIREITNGFEINKYGMGYAIFNEHHNYFYNVSQFQPPQQINNAQMWANSISQAVSAYNTKTIHREYRTERANPVTNKTTDTVIRLSSQNYNDFKNLEGVDTVVLYLKNTISKCVSFFPDFYDFAEDVQNRGFNPEFKFGYFDTGRNGLPESLPDDSKLPYVELYPANNKSYPVRSFVPNITVNDIIILLKAYASNYFPIAAEIPSQEEFSKLKKDIQKNMAHMPLKERNAAQGFIAKLEEMYGDKKEYFAQDVWRKNDLKQILEAQQTKEQEKENQTMTIDL